MVSWRSIWCKSFLQCVCWDLMNFEFMISYIFLYPWKLFEVLWSLICIIAYSLAFLFWYLGFVWQLDLFILQWEEVLCDGSDLTVLDPSDWRGTDTYVSLLLRITRWGLFLHKYILSTSCHPSYCITPFFHELNTLDACWIAVDVWSNSSRCRQESVYKSWTWCLYNDHCLDIVIIIWGSINCPTLIRLPTVCYFLERSH